MRTADAEQLPQGDSWPVLFLRRGGYATSNPVAQAAKAKVPPARIGILSVSEAHRLLLACRQDIFPVVAIGLFAGPRSEEVGLAGGQL